MSAAIHAVPDLDTVPVLSADEAVEVALCSSRPTSR